MTPAHPNNEGGEGHECCRCGTLVELRENTEHTGFCDSCAQELVSDMFPTHPNELPEAVKLALAQWHRDYEEKRKTADKEDGGSSAYWHGFISALDYANGSITQILRAWPRPSTPSASHEHGYNVFLTSNGPFKTLPIAWFPYQEDALAWATEHTSESHRGEVRPATKSAPSTLSADAVGAIIDEVGRAIFHDTFVFYPPYRDKLAAIITHHLGSGERHPGFGKQVRLCAIEEALICHANMKRGDAMTAAVAEKIDATAYCGDLSTPASLPEEVREACGRLRRLAETTSIIQPNAVRNDLLAALNHLEGKR